jgi:hypothetical protein
LTGDWLFAVRRPFAVERRAPTDESNAGHDLAALDCPRLVMDDDGAAAGVLEATRDHELLAIVDEVHRETLTQIKWLKTQVKRSSPQALVVGSGS